MKIIEISVGGVTDGEARQREPRQGPNSNWWMHCFGPCIDMSGSMQIVRGVSQKENDAGKRR